MTKAASPREEAAFPLNTALAGASFFGQPPHACLTQKAAPYGTAFPACCRQGTAAGEPATPGHHAPLFVPAHAAAIIIVAVPAEKPDVHQTSTNGYPRRAEVNNTEFAEHIAPYTE